MIESILNVPVLFFIFGIFAVFLRSNLEIPKGMVEGITLYLMLAIGIKGGISLASEPASFEMFAPTIIVVIGSIVVATYVFWLCRKFVSDSTAAGIAATYGSNSTMTFITAVSFLSVLNVSFGGYMTVALVLMETPAILYAIYLANKNTDSEMGSSIRHALTDGTGLLLIASLIIGFVTVSLTDTTEIMYSFINGAVFTGALCFFLLAMGLKVGHALRDKFKESLDLKLVMFAMVIPWINGALGYAAGLALGLDVGDLFLTTLLMASSSYIVAPAIMSRAVPDAEIGKYLTMSIGITFPMNLLIGIPVWWQVIA